MDEELLFAWACGLYEGEGSCTFGTRCRRLSVANKDREVLERFQLAVGCGTINGPYRNGMLQWQVSRAVTLEALVDRMWPYLSTRRRAQIERVMGARATV